MIPAKPKCPHCEAEGIENLNMIISITTEQPLAFYRHLPTRISLRLRTSHNGSMVNWDKMTIMCRACGYSNKDADAFDADTEVYVSILDKIKSYLNNLL